MSSWEESPSPTYRAINIVVLVAPACDLNSPAHNRCTVRADPCSAAQVLAITNTWFIIELSLLDKV